MKKLVVLLIFTALMSVGMKPACTSDEIAEIIGGFILIVGVPGGGTGGGSDPGGEPLDPDDPGSQVRIRCGTSILNVWTGGTIDTSGFIWAALIDHNELLSVSPAIFTAPNHFRGYYLQIPLDGLSLRDVEYDANVYFSLDSTGIGDVTSSITSCTGWYKVRFPDSLMSEVRLRPEAFGQKSISDNYCAAIGDTLDFTVTLVRNQPRQIRIVPGHNYVSGISWSVEGDLIIPGGTVTSNGRFLATSVAQDSGDCFVVAHENSSGATDSVSVTVLEGCRFVIQVDTNGQSIAEHSCTYIEPVPKMPSLRARVSAPPAGDLRWTLTVRYDRSGRSDQVVYERQLSGNSVWNIADQIGTAFFGGEASLQCILADNDLCIQTFDFSVRGHNPSSPTVEQYILGRPGFMWYWKYIAMHESDSLSQDRYYCQFNEVGSLNCFASDVKYTPNASGDGGFGIYQITNVNRPPNVQELWNWQQNVNTAAGWLTDKKSEADAFMVIERGQAVVWHGDDPAWYWSVPDTAVYSVTFSDNAARAVPSPNLIENAVAIKKYNGATHQFCEWNDSQHEWVFYPLQIYQLADGTLDTNKYVGDVCRLVP